VCNDNIDEMKSKEMKNFYSIFYAVVLALSFLFLNVFLGYLTLNYYNVQTRKKEMGIRRATGANKLRILLSILGENLLTMLPGFLFAFVIFWQLLYVSKFDNWETFWQAGWLALVISLLLTIGSALFPAYIASKVQPVEALSEE
jgi:putative ABC transport system permease protein